MGGWKEGATDIHLTDATFANPEQAQLTVLHEIGHNWDDPEEHRLAGKFGALSSWRPLSDVASAANDNTVRISADGQWVFGDIAETRFTSDYAQTNPMEDFAETFAAYFLEAEERAQFAEVMDAENPMQAKLDLIDGLSQQDTVDISNYFGSEPDEGEVHAWYPYTSCRWLWYPVLKRCYRVDGQICDIYTTLGIQQCG